MGLTVSVVLTVEHAAMRARDAAGLPGGLLCADGGGCATVLASRWAYLDAWTLATGRLAGLELGDVPLAYAGVVFYAVVSGVWLIVLASPGRIVAGLALLAGAAGATASAAFLAVQALAIRALCPLCLASAGASVGLLLAGLWGWQAMRGSPRGCAGLSASLAAAGIVAAALSYLTALHAGTLGVGAAIADPAQRVLARFDGLPITEADFLRDAPDDAFQLELDAYHARAAYIERKADGLALELEARRLGLSRQALLDRWTAEVDQQTAQSIDDDARRLSPDDPDRAHRLAERMRQERRDAFIAERLGELRARHTLTWLLRAPLGRPVQLDKEILAGAHREAWLPRQKPPFDIPTTHPHLPAAGGEPTPEPMPHLEIVVFSDLQCPLCARLDESLEAVRATWPGSATVYFIHFPLAGRDLSELAAVVGEALRDRGADFTTYKRTLYAGASRFDLELIRQAAREALAVGPATRAMPLEIDQLLNDEAARSRVARMAAHARALRLTGTPTLVVNGRVLGGYFEPDTLRERLLSLAREDAPRRTR